MSSFGDLADLEGFSIKKLNIDDIRQVESMMPSNGIVDVNIAERGLVATLEGQNKCQEKLVKVERWIGFMETKKNRAWSRAALEDAGKKGYKTGKDKEWFASSDEEYLKCLNEITLAKACKKWLENKASYFSSWHYSFKTFLNRDYFLEKSANFSKSGYTMSVGETPTSGDQSTDKIDMCGDSAW